MERRVSSVPFVNEDCTTSNEEFNRPPRRIEKSAFYFIHTVIFCHATQMYTLVGSHISVQRKHAEICRCRIFTPFKYCLSALMI